MCISSRFAVLIIITSVCTCIVQANKLGIMDRFLVKRRVETPGESSPGETSSESSTSHPITSGSCASTEGTSDEYCRRDSEAAANATFQAVNTKRRKYGDWKRTFHKDWELDYLVIYESKSDTCICSAIAHSQLLKSISYNDTMKNAPRNSFMEYRKEKTFDEQKKVRVSKCKIA